MQAIVMNLEEDNVGAILLGSSSEIKEGFTVNRTGRVASIFVGEGMLGRAITPIGEPLDGMGPIQGERVECHLRGKHREWCSANRWTHHCKQDSRLWMP